MLSRKQYFIKSTFGEKKNKPTDGGKSIRHLMTSPFKTVYFRGGGGGGGVQKILESIEATIQVLVLTLL